MTRKTHTVRFTGKMKGPPGKLFECLEEYGYECIDVFRCILSCLDGLPVVGVGEANTDTKSTKFPLFLERKDT